MLTTREPKHGSLRLVVDQIWCVSDPTADGYETILPSGRAQIMFSLAGFPLCLDDPNQPHAASGAAQVLQGPSTRSRRVSRRPQRSLCGVSFKPGGVGAFLRPIHHLTDRVVDLAHIWGDDASRLGESLRKLHSHDAKLDLVEHAITKHLGTTTSLRLLSLGLEQLRRGTSVGEVCMALNLSPFQFRNLFHKNVGLMPKHYLRIERFRTAINLLTPTSSLSDLSLDARFSDQSHMTREIHHFAAMTPDRLRRRIRPYAGHVLEPTT